MGKILVLLCLAASIFLPLKAEEEQKTIPLADTEQGISSLVNGSVNAITGDYLESHQDLTVAGPEWLTFDRFYSSSDYKMGMVWSGWRHNHYNYMVVKSLPTNDPRYSEKMASYVDALQASPVYSGKIKNKHFSKTNPLHLAINFRFGNKGLTNSGGGIISGRTNHKNTTMELGYPDIKFAKVTLGSGEKREYKCRYEDVLNGDTYVLTSRWLPSGYSVCYDYDFDKNTLHQVSLGHECGNSPYSFLKFEGNIDSYKRVLRSSASLQAKSKAQKNDSSGSSEPFFRVTASDGRQALYLFKEIKRGKKSSYLLSEVRSPESPTIHYEYTPTEDSLHHVISAVRYPEGRYLLNEYYRLGANDVGGISVAIADKKHDPRINRIKLQKAPVGHDATPITTHRYLYHLTLKQRTALERARNPIDEVLHGATEVFDAYNRRTIYYFDEHERLQAFEQCAADNNRYSLEKLAWGAPGTQDYAHLICKYLQDGSNAIRWARNYHYDVRGNLLEEQLLGNITGSNARPIEISGNGRPVDTGIDCYTKRCTYSDDGMNLLLSETESSGGTNRNIVYKYCAGSDRIRAKFLCENWQIKQREFRHYNSAGIAVKRIIDDGKSESEEDLTAVTERLITYISPKNSPPGLGLPESEAQYALDLATGQEVLIRSLANSYSPEGRLLKQAHYGGPEGKYLYALCWEYDAHGNVTTEQNALGQTLVRRYDANDNLIFEQGPCQEVAREYSYDYANRLIRIDEKHSSGLVLTTHHRYDYLSNRIATLDPLGQETLFLYDEFGRLVKTTSAAISSPSGSLLQPTVCKSYDVMGNVLAITDALGCTTTTSYTVLGKPIDVCYPDGTKEHFDYNIEGTLKASKARSGTVTCYNYDYLGRTTQVSCYSADQQLLSSESMEYNAFHLLASTDAEGHITRYSYDAAGRKTAQEREEKLTTFEYDAAGRLYKTKEWFGHGKEEFIAKVEERDLLDRVIEERGEDGTGRVFSKTNFEYDEAGNRTKVIQQTGEVFSIAQTRYNSCGKPIEVISPNGEAVRIDYDFNYRNSHLQRVLAITETDPLGNQNIAIHDALGRATLSLRKNSLGKVIACSESFFDGAGNQIFLKEKKLMPDGSEEEISTSWSYDSMGHLLCQQEAVGRREEKTTRYLYNAFGEKEAIIKPDGTILHHTYDGMGRLSRLSSSDSTISYLYSYDKGSRPLAITDEKSGSYTTRSYSPNGYLLEENLGNGLSIRYSYDRMGRPLEEVFGDGSSIAFTYEAQALKKVARCNSDGQELYSHSYGERDLAGQLMNASLIGNLAEITYCYDASLRLIEMKSSYGSFTVPQGGFDLAGNLLQLHREDVLGQVDTHYSYDDLYQLTSEQGTSSHTYLCDSLYNRVQKDDKPHALNGLHQLLSDGKASYTYDSNGNRISKESSEERIEYSYDALDRLISAVQGDRKTTYSYDSFNRRLNKKRFAKQGNEWQQLSDIHYLYCGLDEIGAVDEENTFVELRLLGVGKGAEIGAAVAIELKGEVFAPLHDINGNVTALVSMASKQVAETYRYSAFGEEEIFDAHGTKLEKSTLGNPWRFSSKRVDEETAFVYFGRRYYDAAIGRWTTADPLGFEGGTNLYAYLLNNPLVHIDLYGLQWVRWGDNWHFAKEGCKSASGSRHPNKQARLDKLAKKAVAKTSTKSSSKRAGLNPIHFLGSLIETLGRHLLPIGIQDPFTMMGRGLKGEGFEWRSSFSEIHSTNGVYSGNGHSSSEAALFYVCGVNTSFTSCLEQCAVLSSENGNADVHYTYNASHGLVTDLGEVALQILHIPTNSVKQTKLHLENLLSSGHNLIHATAFSQGGLILQRACEQLPSDSRHKIMATTYGSAKMIDGHSLRLNHSMNYVSLCDIIPFLGDPIGCLQGIFGLRHDIVFLKSNSWPIIDHSFSSETYTRARMFHTGKINSMEAK